MRQVLQYFYVRTVYELSITVLGDILMEPGHFIESHVNGNHANVYM